MEKITDKAPLWFVFLKTWNDLNNYGLTLPYLTALVGHVEQTPQLDRKDAEKIIDEIIANPVSGFIVNIRWCVNISSVVFEVQSSDSPVRAKDRILEIMCPKTNEVALVIHDRVAHELGVNRGKDPVLNCLIDSAEERLQKGECSTFWTEEGLAYGPLQKENFEFIERAVSLLI